MRICDHPLRPVTHNPAWLTCHTCQADFPHRDDCPGLYTPDCARRCMNGANPDTTAHYTPIHNNRQEPAMTNEHADATHLNLAVYRTHATNAIQVQVRALDDNGSGISYRLAGPKHYNQGVTTLLEQDLDERDTLELRDMIDAVRSDPRPGDRVKITAVQSYEITWDEDGDVYVGMTGVLVSINPVGVEENAKTGTLDCAPYEVRIDRDADLAAGEIVFVSGVRREPVQTVATV